MNNDDLEKSLNDAMGDIPEQEQPADAEKAVLAPKSTSKRTLKGPMVLRDQHGDPVEKLSEPVPMSFEEMKLRAKLEVLEELLRDERAAKKVVAADTFKAKIEREPEELVAFRVNLPPQAKNIRIDGREYYHGHTYQIEKSQAISMRDAQFMAWKHDEQVQGRRAYDPGYSTSDMSINADGTAISRPIY